MTQANPKLTITLTSRRPVSITKAEWPIIAKAEDSEQIAFGATWKLFVRRHEDGRAIVYGFWKGGLQQRGGELLEKVSDLDVIEAAIKRVSKSLGFNDALANRCIAGLPAQEL